MTNKNKSGFNIPNTEHASITCFILWLALGEALTMLGEKHGNNGWKEDLYEKTHANLDSFIETYRVGDISKIHGAGDIEGAKRTAGNAIDSAFDRIKFI